MGQRSITFAIDEYYHVYNRGTDKRIIFEVSADYKRFIELLYLCNTTQAIDVRRIYRDHISVFDFDRGEAIVAIGAFCLMPNHFHLLVRPLVDSGVSEFMRKLGTAYSMYFNRKNERTGSLFQGKFKAQHAATDEYLKYLYAYIHLNPVKLIQSDWKEEGIKDTTAAFKFLVSYEYSSLGDYLRAQPLLNNVISPRHFPEYFLTAAEHQEELVHWLEYKEYLDTTGISV